MYVKLPENVDFVVKNWFLIVELLKPFLPADSNLPPLPLPSLLKSLKLFFTKLPLFTKLLPLPPISSKFDDAAKLLNDFFGFFTGFTMVKTGWLKLVIGSDGVKSPADDDVSWEPCGWRAWTPPPL